MCTSSSRVMNKMIKTPLDFESVPGTGAATFQFILHFSDVINYCYWIAFLLKLF